MKYSLKYTRFLWFILFGYFSIPLLAFEKNNIGFIENKGQILDQNYASNNDVLYMCDLKGMKVQLRRNGYSYELYQAKNIATPEHGKKYAKPEALAATTTIMYRVDVDFTGMNKDFVDAKENVLEGSFNYAMNGKTITDVHSYKKITYQNIYPNTDIEFMIGENKESPFKYNIILHPGADISKIHFLIKGATSVSLSKEQTLQLTTPLGIITEQIPMSFYKDSPSKRADIIFGLKNNSVSFSGAYDNSKTFIIDPSTNRIWGTFFGGNSIDFCTSNALDASNNVYIAGYTLSSSNIATSGTYQSTLSGGYEAYINKFNTNGTLQWGTYFGGPGVDIFYALHIDASNNIYASGDCNSTTNVATVGAHQTIFGGGIDDAILTKFNTSGQLQWATYYGGNMHDISVALTTDGNGDVIMAGHTQSSASIATIGSYNSTFSFAFDVFVAKFNSNGVRQWATYYGDTDVEEALSVDCDASNNIYVSGFTSSLFGIATGSAYQTINGGNQDGFVAKFNPAGTNLLYGTYYGGTGDDQATGIDITSAGDIFIGGNTTSSNAIASTSAYQITPGSVDDGFLARFNSSGVRQWATYFGGNSVDYISDILVDANNNIIFCGETESSNAISTSNAYQAAITGINNYDAHIGVYSGTGVKKLGTYYGDSGDDNARSIVMDNLGKVYISGETTSTVSLASPGAYMTTPLGGGSDVFVAKFCLAPEPVITPGASATVCANNMYTLSATGGYSSYAWTGGAVTSTLSIPSATPGTFYYKVTVSDAFGCSGASDSVMVFIDPCTLVKEISGENIFTVFPNPSSGIFNLQVGKGTQQFYLEVYNGVGELIMHEQVMSDRFSFDLNDQPPAMYLLKIQSGEKIYSQKIIKR